MLTLVHQAKPMELIHSSQGVGTMHQYSAIELLTALCTMAQMKALKQYAVIIGLTVQGH